ncbi:trehalose utilization protein ThuA [Paenibacillus sp. J31TS4]|uniref:ThuA domain-containing protein n=1 Tax=Paenibacillus sp. J31TS4 TaxID=2807195 RepID=UPI001B0FF5C6|nr:ThuA domain-containing protein [Paenibacillus sp. J31TS4]GIP40743.1 trehalose utilization protein ThuA [Paenibacillus sp. J31TS4]
MKPAIRVTVWNEFLHEKENEAVRRVYPLGLHQAIAEGIRQEGVEVRTATLEEPEHGLTEEVLNETDVLIWWGHKAHGRVEDAIVDRVQERVLQGMGLIVLHSGHYSKIFKKLMGTSCSLKWREVGEKERIWVVDPAHPIAEGIGQYVEIPHEEMYGEHFDIPKPDELVFVSWFEGGEVFRSGCTYHRGLGKVFYFRPGHETYPTYYNPDVLRVISNGVQWAAPRHGATPVYHHTLPLEEIRSTK